MTYLCHSCTYPLLPVIVQDAGCHAIECLDAWLQVAGTSGKVQMDGESDEEGLSSEAHGSAIIEALGWDRRNEVRHSCRDGHLIA